MLPSMNWQSGVRRWFFVPAKSADRQSGSAPFHMPREKIAPFYFGTPSRPLFGCYHRPQSAPPRDCAVVFCHPLGDEYIRFHRAYRQLAVRLSQIGFPVLRFDLYGCGDSSGDSAETAVQQWLTDIATAVAEIRRRSGMVRICLVGLRLGGTLSLMVGSGRGDIDGMVLWDPVVSGKAYVAELKLLHQEMLRRAHVQQKPQADETQTEILGFPLTKGLLTELESIDLATLPQKPAKHLLVIESQEKAGERRLLEHLQQLDAYVSYQHLPYPQFWVWREDLGEVLVPHQVLQSVVAWLAEVYS
jgi:exosortase A-associated hydrolase 2